jgi:hypothetical protein
MTNSDLGYSAGFQLRITGLANLQPEKNNGYSKAFSAFLKEKIGVENDRGYVIFHDMGKLDIIETKISLALFLIAEFKSFGIVIFAPSLHGKDFSLISWQV